MSTITYCIKAAAEAGPSGPAYPLQNARSTTSLNGVRFDAWVNGDAEAITAQPMLRFQMVECRQQLGRREMPGGAEDHEAARVDQFILIHDASLARDA